MNTIILSTVFFSLLCWLIATIFSDRFAVLNAQFDQFRKYISSHLGWPIFFAGLGITLFFIFIYNEMNLEGIAAVDFLRTAVLTIGALGGGYGLILATRRQKVLEEQTEQGQKQIQQGQDQLFNDRLGRGAEMLGHESMAVRVAGIKVLEDLALTSGNKDIIYQIIDKFLHVGAILQQDAEGKILRSVGEIPKMNRHDIFASAEAMIRIVRLSKKTTKFHYLDLDQFTISIGKNERIRILSSQSNHYNSLIISSNLSAQFSRANLEATSFSFSNLTASAFRNSNLKYANFENTNLSGVSFENSNLDNTYFSVVDCTATNFNGAQNFHKNNFNLVFYMDGKAPHHLPKNYDLSEIHAYVWVKRNGRDYRKLLNANGSLSDHDVKDLEFLLNRIPGGPIQDD